MDEKRNRYSVIPINDSSTFAYIAHSLWHAHCFEELLNFSLPVRGNHLTHCFCPFLLCALCSNAFEVLIDFTANNVDVLVAICFVNIQLQKSQKKRGIGFQLDADRQFDIFFRSVINVNKNTGCQIDTGLGQCPQSKQVKKREYCVLLCLPRADRHKPQRASLRHMQFACESECAISANIDLSLSLTPTVIQYSVASTHRSVCFFANSYE